MTQAISPRRILDEDDALTFEPSSPVYQVLEMLVSPKLATAWLEARAPNRTIRQHAVDKYARDMKRGHWLRNGETIKFDRFGRLLDGQHRLWGVVTADVAVEFTVALGLEPDAMSTVDAGMPRQFADVLSIAGTPNARQLAAVARLIWSYEQVTWTTHLAPTHTDLAAILSRFPDLPEWVNEHRAYAIERKLSQQAGFAFVTFMAHRLAPEEARCFSTRVIQGVDLRGDMPSYHLREKMLAWRAEGTNRGQLRQAYVLGMMIKAWNAHLAGKPMRALRYVESESQPLFDPPVPGLRNPAPERKLSDKVPADRRPA